MRTYGEYEPRYRRFGGERDPNGWLRCFYCGTPADTFDHQPPLSRVHDYEALGLVNESYVKVPCCRECNSMLGASLNECLISRERQVKKLIAHKYRSALKTPDWPAEEIKKLGKNIKSKVNVAIEIRDAIELRLDYSGGVNAWIRDQDL